MSFLDKERWGVSGLGSSACKIPNRLPSESAFELHLPRQIPYYYELRRQLESAELALAASGYGGAPAVRPSSLSGYGGAPAVRPSSLSGYGGAPAVRPSSLSGYGGAPAVRPSSLSGYGGGLDRCLVKVPGSIPGKIPKLCSDLGRMMKPMVRYEADAYDPTAVWRIVHLRPSEQPRERKLEIAKSAEDSWQISQKGIQGTQSMSTPEGNFNFPSTDLSGVVTGGEQDQVPNVSVRRMEWENPDEVCVKNDARLEDGMIVSKSEGVEFTIKEDLDCAVLEEFGIPSWLFGLSLPTPGPIQEPTLVQQWPQSPKKYLSQPHSKYQPRQWNPNFSNERVHNFYQHSETNLTVVNNPDEAKCDLAQWYMGERVDRGLRSTGLRWILPPWPDFCMGDSFTQHSGYEVIENFYSVKHYNHSVLDYTEKFEELIKIWPIVNEDYHARVEGREIISNPSKAVGLATMIADKRTDFDNFDEYVRNTIARAFSVIAFTLDISALLPFLKVVCQSKKIVQQIVTLMGCMDMPHLKFLFEIVEHSLSEENQEVKTINALSFAGLAEIAAPYGIESFDTVLKPLWKGIRSYLGKVLAAYLKTEKPSIDEIKLTLLKPFELIASMKNGTSTGKIGKEILDELIAKGGIVKSMMEERDLVQIADPAAIEAMDRKNNFCNMPVIAHVDHGKSALADSLVTAAGIIAQEVAGDVHMTNICADEAERGTTIKSPAISLFYEMTEESLKSYKSERDGNEYIINLIDSPGHVDNSSEVTATLLITYGVLVVVDCIEGVSAQTETVLCHALGERIRPVLTVNIMDRGFLELQVEGEESYQTFSSIIENAHVIMATYEDPLLGDTQVYPEKGIAAFSAGLHGWVFTLSSLAKMYASKLGLDKSKMIERLWGENYFDPTTKKWTIQHTGSATCKRGLVQFYYEPIKQIIKICVNDQKDKWWPMWRKLGVTLKTDEKELMGKALIKSVMQTLLLASNARLGMVIFHLSYPSKAQKILVEDLYEGSIDDIFATAIINCDLGGSPTLYVPRMIPASDKGRLLACGRVFSGKEATGMKVRIIGPNDVPGQKKDLYMTNVQHTVIWMGRKQEYAEEVPCGNTVDMVGSDQFITENTTLTKEKGIDACQMRAMKFYVSLVMHAAVQYQVASDLPKLIESLKRLAQSDPMVLCSLEESGKHICVGFGELHLEICLRDLLNMQLGRMQILSREYSLSSMPK